MAPVSSGRTTGRVSGLEVLRGYAAFSVIFFHVEVLCAPLPPGALKATIETFWYAVPLFFALSAFSLLYGYYDRLFDERMMTRFYMRRYFRLAPLFYVMVLVYWIYHSGFTGLHIPRSQIVLDLTFLFPFLPGKHTSTVYAGWSIGVEWIFYFAFPLLALFARSAALSVLAFAGSIVIGLAMASTSGAAYDEEHYRAMSVLRNLMYFQAGVLAFAIVRRFRIPTLNESDADGRNRVALVMALSVAIIIFNIKMPVGMKADVLLAFACGLWVACAYVGFPRWIDHRGSRFLGRVSYSLYLGHPFVITMLREAGLFKAVAAEISNPYLVLFVSASVTVAGTLVFAAFAYRYIEAPGMALGEWLLSRKRRVPAPVIQEPAP